MRILLGLLRPAGGTARLFGRDPQHELPEALDGVAGFVETPHFLGAAQARLPEKHLHRDRASALLTVLFVVTAFQTGGPYDAPLGHNFRHTGVALALVALTFASRFGDALDA